MYADYFGLNEKPFSISPDPRYLYLSQRHADALAHLLYGVVESGGFIQLTGEVGTGKTTLIRSLLGQLPEASEVALILNPQLSTKQFLQAICHELHVPYVQKDTARMLIDRLNERLLALHASGKRAVLIVDEAQTMSPELLEQVRLLTNLETERQKLLQIILIGQPELREVLARPTMRQIAQRITGRYHLEPLTAADAAVYVRHRIKVAGGRPDLFTAGAIRQLYRLSRGIPRLINVIADRALLGAYTRDEQQIGARLVRRAADEVFGREQRLRWWHWAAATSSLVLFFWVSGAVEDAAPGTIELAMVDATAPASDPIATGPAEPVVPRTPETTRTRENETPETSAATLAALLAGDDDVAATEGLFRLWNADFVPGAADVCDQAESAMLRCLILDGSSISELRQIDRPALLELIDTAGETHRLLLTGLGEREASVLVGGESRRVGIAELTNFGYGSEIVLWRPAVSDPSGALAEGTQSPGVIWLRTTLASLGFGNADVDEPDLFDPPLTASVRSYQQARGLGVDGVVGDRTLLSLQSEIGLVGVRLASGEP